MNATAAPTFPLSLDQHNKRLCAYWLFSVAGLVALMVVVGGVTRLTESGLSIVYWKPVTGILPPLTAAAWDAEFALYQTSPEYLIVNEGMSLAQFKFIYWWEYGHRLLGRVIGLAFALPLILLAVTRRIPSGYAPRFVALLVLGGLQGALGWYMVQSGLRDVPEVSHYRLTAHLMLALIIFAALLWTGAGLLGFRREPNSGARPWAWCLLGMIFVQLILGGFVAGLEAGLIYNSWPLMDGGLAPQAWLDFSPWWQNLLDNPSMIQFLHRMMAYALLAAAGVAAWRLSVMPAYLLLAVLLGQAVLGVLTLVLHVPLLLGALHQFGGVLVLASGLWFAWRYGSAAR